MGTLSATPGPFDRTRRAVKCLGSPKAATRRARVSIERVLTTFDVLRVPASGFQNSSTKACAPPFLALTGTWVEANGQINWRLDDRRWGEETWRIHGIVKSAIGVERALALMMMMMMGRERQYGVSSFPSTLMGFFVNIVLSS